MFEKQINVSKTYYISNANMSTIDEVINIVDIKYQWTIGNYTSVEEVVTDVIPEISSIFNLVPFSHLQNYLNNQVGKQLCMTFFIILSVII